MNETAEPAEPDPLSSPPANGLEISVSQCPDELRDLIRRCAEHALGAEGVRVGQLDIAVVCDDEMRRLHKQWLDRDTTTDVLTFDLRNTPDAKRVDAQLIVCDSVARRKSSERETDWRAELVLYVVHGCLHLCGYDDHEAAGYARMHRREDQLLTELGLGQVFSSNDAGGADAS